MTIQKIIQLLETQKIIGQQGNIKLEYADISFSLVTKDILGSVLQEWFEQWMKKNNIAFSKPENSQKSPDFFLKDGTGLEIKAFNDEANPAFDVANFDAYTRALLTEPERLDYSYLIFSYYSDGKHFSISNFWLKKVWEITGASKTNILNLQVKQGSPVNIRPKDWRSNKQLFNNRKEFVIALEKALLKFHPERSMQWLTTVEQSYKQKIGKNL